MACGTPVVATDVGGVREVIDDGVTGLLAPRDDQNAFATKLAALLFGEIDAAAMGRRARDVAVSRFRRETIVALYEELYRSTLAR
jgi:glycosyltransferase involved in cell wall biosynthesis